MKAAAENVVCTCRSPKRICLLGLVPAWSGARRRRIAACALVAAAADRQLARHFQTLRPLPATGPLTRRLAAFVRQRVRVLEAITPVRRAALLIEPFSTEVAARLGAVRHQARIEGARVFALELAARPARVRRELAAAVGAVTSWSTWHALRAHQRLSRAAAARVLTRMLTALLQEAS